MPDLIEINNIKLMGKHGVYEDERQNNQPFDIDLLLRVDLQAVETSDDIEDTVNYSIIYATIRTIVERESYLCLERLAGVILKHLFEDERIISARIKIAKPGKLSGATPSITLERENQKALPEFSRSRKKVVFSTG